MYEYRSIPAAISTTFEMLQGNYDIEKILFLSPVYILYVKHTHRKRGIYLLPVPGIYPICPLCVPIYILYILFVSPYMSSSCPRYISYMSNTHTHTHPNMYIYIHTYTHCLHIHTHIYTLFRCSEAIMTHKKKNDTDFFHQHSAHPCRPFFD